MRKRYEKFNFNEAPQIRGINGRQAAKIDKNKDGFYIDKEDGGYSVYGSNTGFCYLYSGSKHSADEKLKELETTHHA